jgi:hypothetical protein
MTVDDLRTECMRKAQNITISMMEEHAKRLNDLRKEYDRKIKELEEAEENE